MADVGEAQRGNQVAKAVWSWLLQEKAICYVPWVLDPKSGSYDPVKAARQSARDDLLAALEAVILQAGE